MVFAFLPFKIETSSVTAFVEWLISDRSLNTIKFCQYWKALRESMHASGTQEAHSCLWNDVFLLQSNFNSKGKDHLKLSYRQSGCDGTLSTRDKWDFTSILRNLDNFIINHSKDADSRTQPIRCFTCLTLYHRFSQVF